MSHQSLFSSILILIALYFNQALSCPDDSLQLLEINRLKQNGISWESGLSTNINCNNILLTIHNPNKTDIKAIGTIVVRDKINRAVYFQQELNISSAYTNLKFEKSKAEPNLETMNYYIEGQWTDACIPNDSHLTTSLFFQFHPIESLECKKGKCIKYESMSMCPLNIKIDSMENKINLFGIAKPYRNWQTKNIYKDIESKFKDCKDSIECESLTKEKIDFEIYLRAYK